MELNKLIGAHILSGVEIDVLERKGWHGCGESCNYIKFTLDGVTYLAVEDPDDGYRSYMEDLVVVDEPCKICLPNIAVTCHMREDDTYRSNDVLVFIDALNGKEILAVGTDYSDSYYPYCVLEYTPENMSCNEGR